MSKPNKKPIDRWLSYGGIAMGIALFLAPKTPTVIIICLIAIFVLLIHPVWNFWWIEKKINRRIVAFASLIILLTGFGYYIWPKEAINKEVKNPSAILRERYDKDSPTYFKFGAEATVKVKDKITTIHYQEYYDFQARSKFIGFYIPTSDCAYCVCKLLPNVYKKFMKDLESRIETKFGQVAEFNYTSLPELVFSKRIYIYHEDTFSHQEIASLEKLYQAKGLSVIFRGIDYAMIVKDTK